MLALQPRYNTFSLEVQGSAGKDWERGTPEFIDWRRRPTRRRRLILIVALVTAVIFGSRTAVSYYVDALWFGSLGYGEVFRKTFGLQWAIFVAFFVATFFILYGWFLALRRAYQPDLLNGGVIFIGRQPLKLPVERILRLIVLVVSLLIAAATGAGMMAEWPTFALYWYAPHTNWRRCGPDLRQAAALLSIHPARLAVHHRLAADAGGDCLCNRRLLHSDHWQRSSVRGPPRQHDPIALARVFHCICVLAAGPRNARVSQPGFEALFEEHTIFGGVNYTDAHVTLPGLLVVCAALVLGAASRLSMSCRRRACAGWWRRSLRPQLCYLARSGIRLVCRQLYREAERVGSRAALHCLQHRTDAAGVRIGPRLAARVSRRDDRRGDRPGQQSGDACRTSGCGTGARSRTRCVRFRKSAPTTIFPTSTSIAMKSTATMRQVMLATRELSVDKLPESSRNWINEKLIYTHGYGITMNPVNGFTPEGLPTLILSNMPIQSTVPSIDVTRPEIYFGELTNTDVYVKTRQQEFNYPQGQTNNLTSYEGNGGILLGGFLRRILIAFDRGDLAKLPFSDDINPQSRLLMRRNVRDRVAALAPFLTYDSDPYIVVGDDGRLSWMMDAFTTSDSYPYSSHYSLNGQSH